MIINSATVEFGKLILEVNTDDARRFAYGFKPGDYEIKKAVKKRSLDANAYCWVLCNQLAQALNLPPETIYLNALKDIAGACEIVCVQEKAAKTLEYHWADNHIGRRVETMPSKIPGCVTVKLYYGSSDYDTKQMSRLIENLIQDNKSLGLEVKPREEIESLLSGWGNG